MGRPYRPAPELTFTITPCPAWRMPGSTARMTAIGPSTLTAN